MTKPEDGKADQGDMQHLNGRRDVPTAAEKGEAFFQVRTVTVHPVGNQRLRVLLSAFMQH